MPSEERVSLTIEEEVIVAPRPKWSKWSSIGTPLYSLGSTTVGCGRGESQEAFFFADAVVATYQTKLLGYPDGEVYVMVPRGKIRSISVEGPGASWLVKTVFALLALSAIVCTIGATALVDEFYPTQLIGQGATLVIAACLAAAGLYLMIRPCVARTYIVRIYH